MLVGKYFRFRFPVISSGGGHRVLARANMRGFDGSIIPTHPDATSY